VGLLLVSTPTVTSLAPIARAAALKVLKVLPLEGALMELFNERYQSKLRGIEIVCVPNHALSAVSHLLAVKPNS
jgi:hypothetical protein